MSDYSDDFEEEYMTTECAKKWAQKLDIWLHKNGITGKKKFIIINQWLKERSDK